MAVWGDVMRRLGAVGFVLAALLTGVAHAAAPGPGILIESFDLFDTSIDQRTFVIADQKQWLAEATARIETDLTRNGTVSVIGSPASKALLAGIAHDYEHPSTCRSCALDAARKLGARYVFIGSVHKVSDLIIYMRGELDAVKGDRLLMVKSMEVKADDRVMVLRAADAMAAVVQGRLRQGG